MEPDDIEDALSGAEELSAVLDDLEARSRSFGSAITTALKGAVLDGDSLIEVLQNIAYRFSSISLDVGLKPLETSIGSMVSGASNMLSGAIGFSHGGVPGRVQAFATGGVVSQPTYFPMAGGTGLMGEAGSEAIMPLKRGPDGRLGVAAGEAGAPVQVIFNVNATDAQSFRKSEGQINAMLTRAVGRGRRGV
ncbi:phage tail tape measure protein [Rhizobium sp. TH2]|uniref:phage tail tape measure protein n=1 Tax=Rhizobium sp. TH2 TaxID=2775403 RepID=UPI00215896A2|nr:phage tail tape measure protein [Rhizobium sp. TH2]UVC10353.1 phage tail tape measure protein [Rhizobium sp. TH2]